MSEIIQTIKNKKGVVISPGKPQYMNGVKVYPLIPDKIDFKGTDGKNQK